jgi:phytoene desaturase
MSNEHKVVIIGAGLGGLGLAAMLAKRGYTVHVFEKNDMVGGRASVLEESGYRFDTGPSWYLMPDFFEHFFETIDKDIDDYLDLSRLSPSYRVFFKDTSVDPVDIYSDIQKDAPTFSQLENGAGEALRSYLADAKKMYEISKGHFIYRNYDSFLDFFDPEVMRYGAQLPALFQSAHARTKQYFDRPEVQKLIEYAFLFLGTDPRDAPGVYGVMNYVDFKYGVYYPDGGIYAVVESLRKICEDFGVSIHTDTAVDGIVTELDTCSGIRLADGAEIEADIVVSNADRHFTDTSLLPDTHQEFSKQYWKGRQLAPSAFLMYLGVDRKLPSLTHHNFVFSRDWHANFDAIFDNNTLPKDPSFYICKSSATDDTVAPAGKENVYVLVPISAGLTLSSDRKKNYMKSVLDTLARQIGVTDLYEDVEYQKLFTTADFKRKFNSFQGSALGLSHTLLQSAYFRPNNVHPQLKNMYYVGANTNPGIGMPMVLASAELVYKRIEGISHAQPMDVISRSSKQSKKK